MNIFQYVAASDEYGARVICNKYGYLLENANTPEDVGVCLEQLVGVVGEPAMMDVLSLHPDKDILVETFSHGATVEKKTDCGCGGHKTPARVMDAYVPAPSNQIKESHLFIFAGALLLAAAIISK